MPTARPPIAGVTQRGPGQRAVARRTAASSAMKPNAASATTTAVIAYSGRCSQRNGNRGSAPNIGAVDSSPADSEYATTDASTAGISASDSKSSRYSTSIASNAAPSGVRNTAEIPAATPATISTRRSRSVAGSTVPSHEPIAAPRCIVGPSRPPAPPLPSVAIDARGFKKITRRRTTPPW